MPVKKEEMIRKFTRAIHEGNAAVFGGAGLSRASGFVDWKGLIRPLASDINLDVDKETDLLSIAQYYKNYKGTQTPVSQEIMNAFSGNIENNENVRILTRLPIFTYWTTNYDELIEEGIRAANRNPDVKSESNQLSLIKHDRDAVVYKMHGDVSNPANAVLTKFDYEKYEINRPLFRTALKGDLISKVFLFVGFSFTDPNLDYILSQIHALLGENVQEHFCFFKKVQETDYTDPKEYGYDLAKQEMQIDNLKFYGIQTVLVDSYEEITEILKEIERTSKMNNIFISGSATEFTSPWDKNKAEGFIEKLSGELVRKECKISCGYGTGIGSSVITGALRIIYNEKYRHVDEHLCLRPFPQNDEDPIKRAETWRRYREDMLSETGIAVFIFGNKEDGTGNIIDANGCMEEYEIAKAKGNLIIPIGSTGYAAKKIYEDVKDNISDYPYLREYIDEIGIETDADELVRVIIEIINDHTY